MLIEVEALVQDGSQIAEGSSIIPDRLKRKHHDFQEVLHKTKGVKTTHQLGPVSSIEIP